MMRRGQLFAVRAAGAFGSDSGFGGGAGLAEFLSAVFATDFYGFAGDGDLDGVGVEGVVASSARCSSHDVSPGPGFG